MYRYLRWIFLFLAVVLLSACGGGGDGSKNTPPDKTPPGKNPTGQTTQKVDLSPAKLISVSSANRGEAHVEWLPSQDEKRYNIIYEVHLSTTKNFQPTSATKKAETSEHEASIKGLSPGSLYYVAIVTKSGASAAVSKYLDITVSSIAAKYQKGANVVVQDSAQIVEKRPDSVTLTTAVKPGDYIVGDDKHIYLRKVTQVERSGGKYVAESEPVALGEVFSDLQFGMSYRLEDTASAPQAQSKTIQNRQLSTYTWRSGSSLSSMQFAQMRALSSSSKKIITSTEVKSEQGTYYKVSAPALFSVNVGDHLKYKLNISQRKSTHSFTRFTNTKDQCDEVGGKYEEGMVWDTCSDIPVKLCEVTYDIEDLSGTGSNNLPRISKEGDNYYIEWTPNKNNVSSDDDGGYLIAPSLKVGMGDCVGKNEIETVTLDDIRLMAGDDLPSRLEFVKKHTYTFRTDDDTIVFDNTLTATFAPKIVFDGRFVDSDLDEANAKISATFTVEDLARLRMSLSDDHTFTPKPIYTKRFTKIIMAGYVPIVLTGQMRFMAVAEVESSASVDATLDTGMSYTLSYGLHFDGDRWEVVKDAKSSYRVKVEASGETETTFTVRLIPDFHIEIYELAAAHLLAEPYLYATIGVKGTVTAQATSSGENYSDMDAYFTRMEAGAGMDLHVYAGAAWKTKLRFLKYPNDATYAKISEASFANPELLAQYYDTTRRYKEITVFDKTPIAAIPTLGSDLPDYNALPPEGVDSRAIKVRLYYENIENPLSRIGIGKRYLISFVRWDDAKALTGNARIVPAEGEGEYWVIPLPNHDGSLANVDVRFIAHSTLGYWARQAVDVSLETETDADTLPAYWAGRYGVGGGTLAPDGDDDQDGATNLEEYRAGTDPTDPESRPIRKDTTPPVITILGDNPATVTVGGTYIDAGATAYDETDGNLSVQIVSNTVDTSLVGEYVVIYHASDRAGNDSNATRSIRVIPASSQLPIAKITASATSFKEGETITLSASRSVDPKGEGLRYKWTHISGGDLPNAILGSDENITLDADRLKNVGSHIIGLTVTDGNHDKNSTTITIELKGKNSDSPLSDKLIKWEEEVDSKYISGNAYTHLYMLSLYNDGSCKLVSINLDIDKQNEDKRTKYENSNKIYVPDSALREITSCAWASSSDSLTLSFNDGDSERSIPLSDGTLHIGDTMDSDCDNQNGCKVTEIKTITSPMAIAIAMPVVSTEGEEISFEGSLSSDSDGNIIAYSWREGSSVLSTQASFTEANLSVGTHTITLTVTDDANATASDSVTVTVQSAASTATQLKKTGQTKSYDENGDEVTDGSVKDDGYYQKGVTPNYSRDDDKEIVTDHITGLMWQDDSDAGSVTKNWSDAKAYCENLALGGYSDWRLPSIEELETIVDYGQYNPSATSGIFQHITSGYYWSSTSGALGTDGAWVVRFWSGASYYDSKSLTHYVRCVRGGQ